MFPQSSKKLYKYFHEMVLEKWQKGIFKPAINPFLNLIRIDKNISMYQREASSVLYLNFAYIRYQWLNAFKCPQAVCKNCNAGSTMKWCFCVLFTELHSRASSVCIILCIFSLKVTILKRIVTPLLRRPTFNDYYW